MAGEVTFGIRLRVFINRVLHNNCMPRPLTERHLKRCLGYPYRLLAELTEFIGRRPNSAKVLPEVETVARIRAAYARKAAEVEHWLRSEMLCWRRRLGELTPRKPAELIDPVMKDTAAKLGSAKQEAERELVNAAVEAEADKRDLEAFRLRNKLLDRAPIEPEHGLLPFAVLALGLVVDVVFSAPIFEKGKDFGLIEGAVYAVLFCLMTIGQALNVGFVGLRLSIHVNASVRFGGYVWSAAGIVVASIYHGALAHMRAQTTTNPKASLFDGLISLWTEPLAFTVSNEASFLLVLAFVIFGVGVYEGRNCFADVYWGYSARARRAARSSGHLQALLLRLGADLKAIGKKQLKVAKRKTKRGLSEYDRAGGIAEAALQDDNDAQYVVAQSRLAGELMLKLCEGRLQLLGHGQGESSAHLPAVVVTSAGLPVVGRGAECRYLPPTQLLDVLRAGKEELRAAGVALGNLIRDLVARYMGGLPRLQQQLEAKAREILDAPFGQHVDRSLSGVVTP